MAVTISFPRGLGRCRTSPTGLPPTAAHLHAPRDRREGAKARKALSSELAVLLGRQLALGALGGADGEAPGPANGATRQQQQHLLPGTASATQEPALADGAQGGDAEAVPAVVIPRRWAVLHRPGSDLDFLGALATAALEGGEGAGEGQKGQQQGRGKSEASGGTGGGGGGGLLAVLLTADNTEPGAVAPAAKPGVEDRWAVGCRAGPGRGLACTAPHRCYVVCTCAAGRTWSG